MNSISRRVKLTENGIRRVNQVIADSGRTREELARLSSCTQSTLNRFLQGDKVSGAFICQSPLCTRL